MLDKQLVYYFTRSLQGPVYDADRDHHFKALVVHAHELKNLQGPVYDTGADRAHQFQQGPDSTGHNISMNSNSSYKMVLLH